MNELGFREVDLSDLTISEYNVRKELPDEAIDELAENIEAISMLHPIIITPDNQVICGQRRKRALEKLGIEKTWVKVVDADGFEQTAMSLAEHFQRLDPSDEDIRKAVTYLYSQEKSQRKLAKKIGVSVQTVSNILMMPDEELQKKMDEKGVSPSKGREIFRAFKKGHKLSEEEVDAITDIASKASFAKTKEVTDAIQSRFPINLEEARKEIQQEKFITVSIALPVPLFDKIEEAAKNNRRVIQQEIIATLKKAFK